MFTRCINPRKQGDAGMGVAIGWFACNGWTVCVPLTDSQCYDLVVDNGTELRRVSVKTTTRREPNGSYQVGLRTQGGNKSQFRVRDYSCEEQELLFVACDDGAAYLIPSDLITARTTIVVGGPKWSRFQVMPPLDNR